MLIVLLNRHELKKIMAALDNLTKAISDLTTAVSALPQAGTSGATEEQVQAAADAVNAQTAIITAKQTPPATSAP